MSIMTQFQLPISYEEFKAFDKSINPEQIAPTGLVSHTVTKQDNGITVTDIWESEAIARAFYDGVTAASGMPMPPVSYALVYENNFN